MEEGEIELLEIPHAEITSLGESPVVEDKVPSPDNPPTKEDKAASSENQTLLASEYADTDCQGKFTTVAYYTVHGDHLFRACTYCKLSCGDTTLIGSVSAWYPSVDAW